MTTPFAAKQNRLNQAVFAHLANVEATVAGQIVTGLFDAPYTVASAGPYGMASTQPVLTVQTAAIPADSVGAACTIGSGSYTVAAAEPDGTGVTRLVLELSA